MYVLSYIFFFLLANETSSPPSKNEDTYFLGLTNNHLKLKLNGIIFQIHLGPKPADSQRSWQVERLLGDK